MKGGIYVFLVQRADTGWTQIGALDQQQQP
jgi:hypothetical protein